MWPPIPEENYRKSHFIVEEWVDKVGNVSKIAPTLIYVQRTNTNPPSYPRAYAFGKSRYVAEQDIERVVEYFLPFG